MSIPALKGLRECKKLEYSKTNENEANSFKCQWVIYDNKRKLIINPGPCRGYPAFAATYAYRCVTLCPLNNQIPKTAVFPALYNLSWSEQLNSKSKSNITTSQLNPKKVLKKSSGKPLEFEEPVFIIAGFFSLDFTRVRSF